LYSLLILIISLSQEAVEVQQTLTLEAQVVEVVYLLEATLL
jgi:hypothetical protein